MSFKIAYTKLAVRDINKLDKVSKKRIKKKIEYFIDNPKKYAKPLIDRRIGSYRWRAGDYRIVFDIKGKMIIVLRVGHRREVYK